MRKTSNYLREKTFRYKKKPWQLIYSSAETVKHEDNLYSPIVGPGTEMDGQVNRCGHTWMRMWSCFFQKWKQRNVL